MKSQPTPFNFFLTTTFLKEEIMKRKFFFLKMNTYKNVSGKVVPLLFLLLSIGCATSIWNSRIGTYTYDQVIKEIGQPNSSERNANSDLVAEWIERTSSFVGTGSTMLGKPEPAEGIIRDYLRMTFNSKGILQEVKKVEKIEWTKAPWIK
jgi:hypothetical protein